MPFAHTHWHAVVGMEVQSNTCMSLKYSGGGSLSPVQYSGGGSLGPVQYSGGGSLSPVQYSGGGSLSPVQYSGGGSPSPVQYSGGGSLSPVQYSGGVHTAISRKTSYAFANMQLALIYQLYIGSWVEGFKVVLH